MAEVDLYISKFYYDENLTLYITARVYIRGVGYSPPYIYYILLITVTITIVACVD